MKHGLVGPCALLMAAITAAPGAAQTVYRCGPNGNVYSQQPCADGKALDVNDPRTATQQRDARADASKNAQQAKAMQREREKAERASKPAAAGSLRVAQPEPAPQAAKPPKVAASKPTLYIEPIKPKPSKP